MRFKPRLVRVEQFNSWLVQVHPETIEVFNSDGKYVCQVRWIDGKIDCCQGGLPWTAMYDMFKSAN